MKIKGAMTILNKRAKFYGWKFDQLITKLDAGFDESYTVLVAYEVYKMDQGYRWKGTEGDTWVKVIKEAV